MGFNSGFEPKNIEDELLWDDPFGNVKRSGLEGKSVSFRELFQRFPSYSTKENNVVYDNNILRLESSRCSSSVYVRHVFYGNRSGLEVIAHEVDDKIVVGIPRLVRPTLGPDLSAESYDNGYGIM